MKIQSADRQKKHGRPTKGKANSIFWQHESMQTRALLLGATFLKGFYLEIFVCARTSSLPHRSAQEVPTLGFDQRTRLSQFVARREM